VRKEQSAGIRRYLESRSDQTCPVICFGDFNFGKDESLGDVKGWGKYSRDVEVKKFLAPYQPINPYRLRKPIVD
jgi:hypothetical protein